MKEAKHCYLLSNGVAVVAGDKVKLVTDEGTYVGDIIDVSTKGIWIKLSNGRGEVDVNFDEVEDVQLVK